MSLLKWEGKDSLISKEEDFKINMEILQAANKEKPMLNKCDQFSWLLVPE